MEFNEVVRRRRMVRRYEPDRPVPDEVLMTVLRHATRSPSAGFSQGWDFVVLTDAADREAFWTATTDPDTEPDSWLSGVRSAPCLILCCSDKGAYLRRYAEPDKGWTDQEESRWPVPYWDIDTGMASLLMLLTAVDEGLAALFFGVQPDRQTPVKEAFGIPANRRVVGVVSMGYPAPDRPSPSLRRGRRGLDEIAHFGRFGEHRANGRGITDR